MTQLIDTWTPTDAEYFAATDWLSHSEFKLFAKSPRLYEHHVINGVPVKRNESMEFGSEVDTAVFHPDGFGGGMVIAPESVLGKGGIRSGAAYTEFVAANPGKVICKRRDPVVRALDSLHDHAEARGVLESLGECQVALRWESEVNGVPLKRRAKLDKLPTGLPFIADLKTTKDVSASSFAKDIITFKYHTQAEWYRDAVEARYGVRPPFLIVAVQNCEPFDCEVYELNETFLMLGRKLIDDKLAEYVACRSANKWRPTSHDQIVKLAPPYWAEKELTAWNL
jgi:hypothetical protein